MHTVAANAYGAYRSLRARLADTISPPEIDPLCALVVRLLWLNGSSLMLDEIRGQFALPPSTMSSALGRLQARDYIRRSSSPFDRRHVIVSLTHGGRAIAPAVTATIAELERDILDAAGDVARRGFDRVAMMLAAMDEDEG